MRHNRREAECILSGPKIAVARKYIPSFTDLTINIEGYDQSEAPYLEVIIRGLSTGSLETIREEVKTDINVRKLKLVPWKDYWEEEHKEWIGSRIDPSEE